MNHHHHHHHEQQNGNGNGNENGNGNGWCFPFTPIQWQELEQQALIFKHMASGLPIPPDLLLPIQRSSFYNLNSPPPPLFPHHHPSIGWGGFPQIGIGMGLGPTGGGGGRRAEDPEPGRCRRTDGKKWRCSKEAYPDSKYCERHMHRGKNRSRKPVEISLSTTTTTNNNPYAFMNPPHHPYQPHNPPPNDRGEDYR